MWGLYICGGVLVGSLILFFMYAMCNASYRADEDMGLQEWQQKDRM